MRAESELLTIGATDRQRLGAMARMLSNNPEMRDAYAHLLSGIRLSTPFGSGKSILVTSTQPNEGKTTVASCLAIAASLAGQTVLLVDGDLRRPSLTSSAVDVNGVGFGEILDGRAETAEAIHSVELFPDRREAGTISIIGAGGKSAEFLAAVDWSKARTILQSIATPFDLVLVDSPPILAANDALLLAGVVDGVLLVVGAGDADRTEVRKAKEKLDPIGTQLIGAVLNQFDPKLHGPTNQPYLGYNLGDPR